MRVGDELAAALEAQGLSVLHDREIYDYPSYTGSYSRSGAAVEEYLAQYPDIAVVIDLHRDALGDGDAVSVGTVAGQERYDADTHPHAHFICSECGRVLDVCCPCLSALDKEVERETGGAVSGHSLSFSGTCQGCLNGQKTAV